MMAAIKYSSCGVCRLDSRPSRPSPVFKIAAKIEGWVVRLGLDTLAGVSCVGAGDLTKEQRSRAVPTSERLHQADGEALRSTNEVMLCVELGRSKFGQLRLY